MNNVCFILSTGRCGTQWLARVLGEVYPDLAVVTHEPLKAGYRPKYFLRRCDNIGDLRGFPEIGNHVALIERLAEDKVYVETGWPAFAAIPLFCRHFRDRTRVVHLVRHPVQVAYSLVTHGFYLPEIRNDSYTKFAQLEPWDHGVIQKKVRHRWDMMTAYEKALFHWTEINLYGLEVKARFKDIPFILVRYEDFFSRGSILVLKEVIDFIGLPFRDNVRKSVETAVDEYRWHTDFLFDWRQIFNYPYTVRLANKFGYDLKKIDEKNLLRRYYKPWWWGALICLRLKKAMRKVLLKKSDIGRNS